MKTEDVIAQIGDGGLKATARKLAIPVPTLQHWKRTNRVPEWRQAHVRKVAAELGIHLIERDAA